MQFEPDTFSAYAYPVPPGGTDPPSPYDPVDAVYAAARDLCANGAKGGADIPGAVYAYNHSRAYVAEVLSYAASYAAPGPGPGPAAATSEPAAAEAVLYALAQIGTPYRWGGETPGVGFDCSGLTQAAYAAAGIAIPRTSEAQWSALPHVPLGALQPGDLVFFDPGELIAGLPGHVGIYIGNDEMIDAPHTGASVRVESLAGWPRPFGAARPGAVRTAADHRNPGGDGGTMSDATWCDARGESRPGPRRPGPRRPGPRRPGPRRASPPPFIWHGYTCARALWFGAAPLAVTMSDLR